MAGDVIHDKPRDLDDAEARYRMHDGRVRVWFRSIIAAPWVRDRREPTVLELVAASETVKSDHVEVPEEIIDSAEIALEERKFVDGWYRSQEKLGNRVAWATTESSEAHQHYTSKWKVILSNLQLYAPPKEQLPVAESSIATQLFQLSTFYLHLPKVPSSTSSSAASDVMSGTSTPITTTPSPDTTPTTSRRNETLWEAACDYAGAMQMITELCAQFSTITECRLPLAWMITFAVAAVASNSWFWSRQEPHKFDESLSEVIRIAQEELAESAVTSISDAGEDIKLVEEQGSQQEEQPEHESKDSDKGGNETSCISAAIASICTDLRDIHVLLSRILPMAIGEAGKEKHLKVLELHVTKLLFSAAYADETSQEILRFLDQAIELARSINRQKHCTAHRCGAVRMAALYLTTMCLGEMFQARLGSKDVLSKYRVALAILFQVHRMSMKADGSRTSLDTKPDPASAPGPVLATAYAKEVRAAVSQVVAFPYIKHPFVLGNTTTA